MARDRLRIRKGEGAEGAEKRSQLAFGVLAGCSFLILDAFDKASRAAGPGIEKRRGICSDWLIPKCAASSRAVFLNTGFRSPPGLIHGAQRCSEELVPVLLEARYNF